MLLRVWTATRAYSMHAACLRNQAGRAFRRIKFQPFMAVLRELWQCGSRKNHVKKDPCGRRLQNSSDDGARDSGEAYYLRVRDRKRRTGSRREGPTGAPGPDFDGCG